MVDVGGGLDDVRYGVRLVFGMIHHVDDYVVYFPKRFNCGC